MQEVQAKTLVHTVHTKLQQLAASHVVDFDVTMSIYMTHSIVCTYKKLPCCQGNSLHTHAAARWISRRAIISLADTHAHALWLVNAKTHVRKLRTHQHMRQG
jgi:hypothetical protein